METAIRALRHLSPSSKNDLFSSSIHPKYNAAGLWYEAIIYERLIELAHIYSDFKVVRKLTDVAKKDIIGPELGQDGLYYDKQGAIVARGNGQDLGELDIIITNNNHEIVIGEATISKNNLETFGAEVEYKHHLVNVFFPQSVEFLLISSLEVGDLKEIKRISNASRRHLVVTGNLEEYLEKMSLKDISPRSMSENFQSDLIPLSDLKADPINYLQLHDQTRIELMNAAINNQIPTFKGNYQLVKRILIGRLDESSINALLSTKRIIFQEEELTSGWANYFSKGILSINLSELRPVIYLRAKKKFLYLKMGPNSNLVFKFERIIIRNNAFFKWLDNTKTEINIDLMNILLNRFLTKDLAGHKKKGHEPKLSSLLHNQAKEKTKIREHEPSAKEKLLKILGKSSMVTNRQLSLETNLPENVIVEEIETLIRIGKIKVVEINSVYSPETGKVEEWKRYALKKN